jgi:kynurenine formamidase
MCQHHDHYACIGSANGLVDAFRGKRVVDLSRRLEAGIPTYPTHPKFFQMRWCSLGDPAEMNQLVLSEHTGTHIDAPSHFVPGLDDPARRHIDEIPLDRFMGRAVKLTFGPFEPVNALVTADHIRAWERDNVAIEAGDVVLCDFQWGHRWQPIPAGFAYLDRWPGLSGDAAELLAERKVKLVGTDCISLDPGDGGGGTLAAHYTLLPQGVQILENVCNLGQLDVVSYFMAFPLPIASGTGSPVRAVAFVADGV